MDYITIGETQSVLIAALLLFFMNYTKPRKTYTYSLFFSGVILALIEAFLSVFMGEILRLPAYEEAWGGRAFLGGLYALLYAAISCHLFIYLSTLIRRELYFRKRVIIISIGYIAAFYVLGVILYARGYLDIREEMSLVRFCAWMGLLMTAVVLIEALRSLRSMSRIVRVSLFIFVPIEVTFLVLQILAPRWVFLGLSYTIPLTIFYLLFHSNPFNELSGTQNADSLNNYLTRLLEGNDPFLAVFVDFPQLRKQTYLSGEYTVRRVMVDVCQRMERLSPRLSLFQINDNIFAVIVKTRSEEETGKMLSGILDAMEGVNHFGRFHTYYKAVAIRHFPEITMLRQFYGFWNFLQLRLKHTQESECFIATHSMLEKYQKEQRVRATLEDIRDRADIEDPRVLCYAQAIYSVKNNNFRTAESLMRLQIDDDIYAPYEFIPIAEEMHCIHDLTRVMLFKVCRAVKELEKEHDFDGITINCSANEFMDRDLHRDLLGIIDNSKIDHKHVRFEITESSMGDQYDSVLYNMEKMNEAGIMFYLDDFGTGYSNLERILTCPFDTIKFDKSMLYKGMQDKAMDSIVTTMVDVLKESDKVMLVEGVETEEQCTYSIDRGFDYIQGFKYAKPLPIEELANYFDKREGK